MVCLLGFARRPCSALIRVVATTKGLIQVSKPSICHGVWETAPRHLLKLAVAVGRAEEHCHWEAERPEPACV